MIFKIFFLQTQKHAVSTVNKGILSQVKFLKSKKYACFLQKDRWQKTSDFDVER